MLALFCYSKDVRPKFNPAEVCDLSSDENGQVRNTPYENLRMPEVFHRQVHDYNSQLHVQAVLPKNLVVVCLGQFGQGLE